MKSRAAWVLLLALAASCADAPEPDVDTPIDMPPRAVATTDLTVGDSVPDMSWFHTMAVAPDGRLVTAHPEETLLRVFSQHGALERTIGGAGTAPGRFTAISTIGFVGDTLWVLDPAQRRFTRFDLEGRVLDAFDVPAGDIEPLGILVDGRAWGIAGAQPDYVAVTLGREGTALDTIAHLPASPSQWVLTDPASPQAPRGVRPQPFADHALVAFARNATEAVRVTRDATAPGIDTFTVARLSLDGETLASRAFAYRAEEIPVAFIERLTNEYASNFLHSRNGMGSTATQMRIRAYESLYIPPALPPVSAMLLGTDGSLWLRRESDGGPIVDWWILSRDLVPQAVVPLPAAFNALAADSTHVWGLRIEPDLTPALVRYTVVLQP